MTISSIIREYSEHGRLHIRVGGALVPWKIKCPYFQSDIYALPQGKLSVAIVLCPLEKFLRAPMLQKK